MLLLAFLLLLSLPLVALGYVVYRLVLWLRAIFGYYLMSERKAYRKKFLLSLAYLAGSTAFVAAFLAVFYRELTFM